MINGKELEVTRVTTSNEFKTQIRKMTQTVFKSEKCVYLLYFISRFKVHWVPSYSQKAIINRKAVVIWKQLEERIIQAR
jgi:hypothetical protein